MLPSELLVHVLRLLDAPALCALARTSRALRRAADRDELWYALRRRQDMQDIFMGSLETDKEIYRWHAEARRPLPDDDDDDDDDVAHARRGTRPVMDWRKLTGTTLVYSGDWSDGLENGFGVARDLDGRVVFCGNWRDGLPAPPYTRWMYASGNPREHAPVLRNSYVRFRASDPAFVIEQRHDDGARFLAVASSPDSSYCWHVCLAQLGYAQILGVSLGTLGVFRGADVVSDQADGTQYVGEMHMLRPHGHGTFYWPDGSFYHGVFERGCRQHGVYYCASAGTIEEQKWHHREASAARIDASSEEAPPRRRPAMRVADGDDGPPPPPLFFLPAAPRVDMQAAIARFECTYRAALEVLSLFTRECDT